jgi:hypothetical protein
MAEPSLCNGEIVAGFKAEPSLGDVATVIVGDMGITAEPSLLSALGEAVRRGDIIRDTCAGLGRVDVLAAAAVMFCGLHKAAEAEVARL